MVAEKQLRKKKWEKQQAMVCVYLGRSDLGKNIQGSQRSGLCSIKSIYTSMFTLWKAFVKQTSSPI